jgi:hypothetical protein
MVLLMSGTPKSPDPDKIICVLTDGSDRFYAGLVTQIHEEQLVLSMEEQDTSKEASSVFVSRVCSAARTNVVFTNSYVDNNSSLISK